MRRIALLTTLLATLAAPSVAAAASVNIVSGAGFGHGIGMSQYGAYGFAQQGTDYRRILGHYYRGTKIGSAPSRPVRVLLQASDPFVRIKGATRIGARALEPGRTYVVRPAGGGRLAVSGVGRVQGPVRVTGSRPIQLLGPALNGISSGRYRGDLVLRPGAFGGVTAINLLSIDPYVRGVVAGEMPSSWDSDALRAQSVAARTYALATRKTGEVFDLYPDTRSQVYTGVTGETSTTDSAVAATSNEVVTYDGEIATTFFFSTSGGQTENVELSFLGSEPQPWLKSVKDPFDRISPKHRWRFRFSDAAIAAKLGAPGAFRRVEVLRRGRSPRIVEARVVGARGSRELTGASIRARLDLFDSWAYFTRVSTSQVKRKVGEPRAARRSLSLAGVFAPAPRSERLAVERRKGGSWRQVGEVQVSSGGRYRTTVARPGAYRVRSGSVAGPAVRVR
ncbi:MAG: SpoIID/LytB domain-containing protein [Thermoleophilaceae bacterium]